MTIAPAVDDRTARLTNDRHAALILESAIDYAIIGINLAGLITSWNEGARRILGWADVEIVGHPVETIFTPEDRAAGVARAEMKASIEHGQGSDERWHLRRDGSRFWANGEMMPLRDATGALEGYVKILRDRTEQWNSAAALASSEERYRTLYDHIEEGFCLVEVDCDDRARPIDYRFLEVNAAFEKQTGLVGAAGRWMRDLAPDHEEHWFEIYAKVALSGESIRFTLPAVALDGRWFEVFAYRAGKPTDRRVAILFSDITDQRRREAALKSSAENLRQANETLRGSETNLRRLLDTISEGFYAVDQDGVTTTCNRAFLRMMGFEKESDAVGQRLHDVIHHSHPDGTQYAARECPIYVAASQGTSGHVAEELFFPVEGPPLWVEYWATPIYHEGELEGAICTFLDISERKGADDARRMAETRRLALFELSDRLRDMIDPAAMAVVPAEIIGRALGADIAAYGRIDAAGHALMIDKGWSAPNSRSIGGKHPMRAYGSYINDLLMGSPVAIDDVRRDRRTAASLAAFQAAGFHAFVNVPLIEMGQLSALFCVMSAEPREWGVDEVAFISDVAERTRAAIERRRAEAKLQEFADTLRQQVADRTKERDQIWQVSRDMLGVADSRGVWLSVNPAWTKILGWPAEAIVGKTSEWIEHRDDRAKTRAEVVSLAAGNPTLMFENRLRTREGDYRDLSWTAVPLDGLIYCVTRDVTEQKLHEAALLKAEDQLRQSQKVEAVGQLTGGVAHDFNNLLTVIRGSVDLLRRGDLPTEKRKRYIDAIADTADRATRLTSQLLAFARRQALKPEIFDAGESVQAMRDMVATLVGSRVTLITESSDCPCLVNADRSQFDTAIVNMAANGRDAMNGEGELTMTVSTVKTMPALRLHPAVPGDFVTVSIRDTGMGIAPDQIDRIFEPFFTTKGVGHGTGLGLSQVFGFAKQSGGDILVESVEGRGSVFTLYLPVALTDVTTFGDTATSAGPTLGKGACILVVEDNPEVGTFATQALSELGYKTVLAVDGVSALVELGSDSERFDVVFSDVVMPGMSGIELAQEIRQLYPKLPVILTSGYSSVLAADSGHGFALLHKPYSIDELSQALQKVSDGRISTV